MSDAVKQERELIQATREAIGNLLEGNTNMASGRWKVLTKAEVDDLLCFKDKVARDFDVALQEIQTIQCLTMENRIGGPRRAPGFLSEMEEHVFKFWSEYYLSLTATYGITGEIDKIYADRNTII